MPRTKESLFSGMIVFLAGKRRVLESSVSQVRMTISSVMAAIELHHGPNYDNHASTILILGHH